MITKCIRRQYSTQIATQVGTTAPIAITRAIKPTHVNLLSSKENNKRVKETNASNKQTGEERRNGLKELETALLAHVKSNNVEDAQFLLRDNVWQLPATFFQKVFGKLSKSKSLAVFQPLVVDLNVQLEAMKRVPRNNTLCKSMVHVMGNLGNLPLCLRWFNMMKTGFDLPTLHSVLVAYTRSNKFSEGLDLLLNMKATYGVTPTSQSYCILMECGDKYQMAELWREMRSKGLTETADEQIFCSIVRGLLSHNEMELAIGIYEHMFERGIPLENTTLVAQQILDSCKDTQAAKRILSTYKHERPNLYRKLMRGIKANDSQYYATLIKK